MVVRLLGSSFALVLTIFCLCSCCDDNDTATPPIHGTIIVDSQPESISPTWHLDGPDSYQHDGQGDKTLGQLDPGDYTLTWGEYLNWATPGPNPQNVTLEAGNTETIQGTYVRLLLGTVVITVTPVALMAGWEISGPDSYSLSGSGAATIPDVPEGSYEITWQTYDLWIGPNPNPMLFDVVDGETTTVSAVYEPGLPFPGSPDVLMQNFQTIYETRDFDEYFKIMHPDFLTILQDDTIEEFPDLGETLDANEDLRIHQRMFSGDAVTDPDGELVPGVNTISFSRFINLSAWALSPPTDIIPNAEFALYDVEFLFDRGQSFSTLKVNGLIKFYVTSRDSMHQGSLRQYYQMIGQVDLTDSSKKSSETHSWGNVKAMFR